MNRTVTRRRSFLPILLALLYLLMPLGAMRAMAQTPLFTHTFTSDANAAKGSFSLAGLTEVGGSIALIDTGRLGINGNNWYSPYLRIDGAAAAGANQSFDSVVVPAGTTTGSFQLACRINTINGLPCFFSAYVSPEVYSGPEAFATSIKLELSTSGRQDLSPAQSLTGVWDTSKAHKISFSAIGTTPTALTLSIYELAADGTTWTLKRTQTVNSPVSGDAGYDPAYAPLESGGDMAILSAIGQYYGGSATSYFTSLTASASPAPAPPTIASHTVTRSLGSVSIADSVMGGTPPYTRSWYKQQNTWQPVADGTTIIAGQTAATLTAAIGLYERWAFVEKVVDSSPTPKIAYRTTIVEGLAATPTPAPFRSGFDKVIVVDIADSTRASTTGATAPPTDGVVAKRAAKMLATYGFTAVAYCDVAQPGTLSSTDWAVADPGNGIDPTNSTNGALYAGTPAAYGINNGPGMITRLKAAVQAAIAANPGCKIVFLDSLGINDGRSMIAGTIYQKSKIDRANYLLAWADSIGQTDAVYVFGFPTYYSYTPLNSFQQPVLDYLTAIEQVASQMANNVDGQGRQRVMLGDRNNYYATYADPTLLVDGIHYTNDTTKVGALSGCQVVGENEALALRVALDTAHQGAPTVTGVTINPSNATYSGAALPAFTATVTGSPGVSQAVTWAIASATAPTVASGSVTIPGSLTYLVTATSVADPSKSGTAMLTVPATLPAPIVGLTPDNLVAIAAGVAANLQTSGAIVARPQLVSGPLVVDASGSGQSDAFGNLTLHVGDTGSVDLVLRDSGKPLALDGWTATGTVTTLTGTVISSNIACTVVYGPGGVVRYPRPAAETAAAGRLLLRVKLVGPGGQQRTLGPITEIVTP